MEKKDILKILSNRLEKHSIEEKDMILEWVDELIVETEKKQKDILTYAERLYEKRYPDEIYVEHPVPPKLRVDIYKFQKSADISEIDYRKYAEWLVEMCPRIVNRKTVPYDLTNSKLYEQFKKRIQEDTVVIQEKKSLSKNRLLKL